MWEEALQWITQANDRLNALVWGVPGLLLLVGTGIYFTIRTGFFQVVHFGHWNRNTILAIFQKKDVRRNTDSSAISQFAALATALSATIGTGNIAGVATALALGGPGAVFWMWFSAFFGMMTNYSENVLGIYYRKKNEANEWTGGAMYYIEEGFKGKKFFGRIGRPLAVLFCVFAVTASFGIGNMSQMNSISTTMEANFGIPVLVTGFVLAGVAALVIVGGIQRIARVTEKLVPFMAVFYIVGALVIFFTNIEQAGYIFSSIFADAFNFSAVAGGVGGYVIKRAVTWGFKRGVFSNEAGLGSSVMVHSASNVKEPVIQGMWGIFEVFFDTIVVCTMTAFILLSSTTNAVTLKEALSNVSVGTQYFELADRANYTGEIPLIDEKYNEVITQTGAEGEGSDVTITTADGRAFTYALEPAAEIGEKGYIYTNVMSVTGVDGNGDGLVDSVVLDQVNGAPLVTYAFSQRFGDWGAKFVTIAVLLFAFSTILGWSYYGTKTFEYLFGTKATTYYKVAFVAMIVVGATMKLQLAWDLSDTFNGLMMIPNLIGILVLSGTVVKITRSYTSRKLSKHPSGEEPVISAYPDIQKAQVRAIKKEERDAAGA